MSGLTDFYIPPREAGNKLKGCLSLVVFVVAGVLTLMLMFMIVAYFK